MDGNDLQLVKLWLKLHTAIHNPEGEDNSEMMAFPDFSVGQVLHLEWKMQKSAKVLGHDLQTATEFRKQLKTRNKRLDGPRWDAVLRSFSLFWYCCAILPGPGTARYPATFRAIWSLIDDYSLFSYPPREWQWSENIWSSLPTQQHREWGWTSHCICSLKGKTTGKAVRAKRGRSTPPPTVRRTPSPTPTPNPKRVFYLLPYFRGNRENYHVFFKQWSAIIVSVQGVFASFQDE